MATRAVAFTASFVAWDTSANAAKTGDAANITARLVKDGTSAALTTTTVTEVDSTNFPGLYKVAISSTEADCNELVVGGKSSTANIAIIPTTYQMERLPDAVPGAAGGVFIAGTNAATTVTTSFTTTFTGNLTGSVGSVTGAVGSVTGNVGGNVTGSVGSVAAGGITASSFAADAITAAKIAADVGAEIADAVWDEATAGHTTAGSFGKLDQDINTEVVDVQSRIPAALISGRIDATVGAMQNTVITAASIASDAITAAKIADGAIDAATFAASALDAVWSTTTRQLTGTQTFNLTGNITGNLSGSVGSVTGAVGSVTGNVGGNVAGSVGSVTGAVGSVTGNVGGNVTGTLGSFTAAALAQMFTLDTTKTFADAVAGSVVKETADNAGGGGGSTDVPILIGGWTKSGSTYYVTYALVLNGAIITSSLTSLSATFYDEDGTDLTFSGTPAASAAGLIYANGTLGTAVTANRPVFVKVAVTHSAVAYSSFLPGASVS